MAWIEIEVDEATAELWRTFSSKFKKIMSKRFSADIDFITRYYGNDDSFTALDEIGEQLARRGLTEEMVNEFLNSAD